MPGKVLIIEDDPNTTRLVGLYLSRDGYRVISAANGQEGLQLAREAKPDLIVLDLMLPGMSGMDICRTLRDESMVPIVMLTARVEEKDRLNGLDVGADDYVTKPFSPRELAARVRAVLRRTAREALDRGPGRGLTRQYHCQPETACRHGRRKGCLSYANRVPNPDPAHPRAGPHVYQEPDHR